MGSNDIHYRADAQSMCRWACKRRSGFAPVLLRSIQRATPGICDALATAEEPAATAPEKLGIDST